MLQPVHGEEAPASSEPLFKFQLLDGRTISGRVTSLGVDGTLKIASIEGTVEDISPNRLLKLTRDPAQSISGADGALLLFPEGDSLSRVSILSSNENSLEIGSHDLGKLKVPLESLLGIVFFPPVDRESFDTLIDRVRNEPRASEVLWMSNGDRRMGGFLGLGERAIKFQVDTKPMEIDRTGVVALGFDPTLVTYPHPKPPFFEISLTDGTRLGLTECQLDRGQLSGLTRFGSRIQFPITEVVSIYSRSDVIEFISDREVAAVQYVPYIGPSRPYRVNRAVDGGRLSLSGQTYERGLGTQSRTLLAYKLKPSDRRFQAMVGLDDRAGSLGSVSFRVLLDGKERFVTPSMSARDPAKLIDLELAGAKTLILITEFGDRGDVRDLADWVDARIVH